MKYVLSIECDNAAFEEAPLLAIATMPEAQAEKMKRWGDSRRWSDCILDVNGNSVGRSELCEVGHD